MRQSFTLGEITPYTGDWMVWMGAENVTPSGIRSLERVAILTELSWANKIRELQKK
jgi:hypothetical protein